jgi:hypothetical protein
MEKNRAMVSFHDNGEVPGVAGSIRYMLASGGNKLSGQEEKMTLLQGAGTHVREAPLRRHPLDTVQQHGRGVPMAAVTVSGQFTGNGVPDIQSLKSAASLQETMLLPDTPRGLPDLPENRINEALCSRYA